MQREQDGGVIISCDFCGEDWDQIKPMIEGHRGSVLCLECLKLALPALERGSSPFNCPLCVRNDIPASTPRWSNPLRPVAIACKDCLHQAARAFDKDPDVDWKWVR